LGLTPSNMCQNDQKPTSLMTSLTRRPETHKKFFSLQARRLAESFKGLNSSLAQPVEELRSW